MVRGIRLLKWIFNGNRQIVIFRGSRKAHSFFNLLEIIFFKTLKLKNSGTRSLLESGRGGLRAEFLEFGDNSRPRDEGGIFFRPIRVTN